MSHFPCVKDVVNYNINIYVWLGWCGMRSNAHLPLWIMFWRFNTWVWWKESKDIGCDMQHWTTFTPSCMYMCIEQGENVKAFMSHGRDKVIWSFTQHLFSDSWTWYFWTYYFQLGTWFNFQSMVVPPCCAYKKIFIPWIKVKTPKIQAIPMGVLCMLL